MAGDSGLIATARMLSPFPNGSGKGVAVPRPGLDDADVMKPVPNRASRRAARYPRLPKRPIAIPPALQPWKAT